MARTTLRLIYTLEFVSWPLKKQLISANVMNIHVDFFSDDYKNILGKEHLSPFDLRSAWCLIEKIWAKPKTISEIIK